MNASVRRTGPARTARPVRPAGRRAVRRAGHALAAAGAALLLAACGVVDAVGGGGDAKGTPADRKRDDITVGLLLPDKETRRFERFDRPLIEARLDEVTHGKGRLRHANALASAKRQNEQLEEMIEAKVDVILLTAVDSAAVEPQVRKAEAAGIPVIAYDRLARGPVEAYVSHDNELVGEVQGRALLEALGKGSGSRGRKVVMINGSPDDPNSARFRTGALSVLGNQVDIAATYDTKDWQPKAAAEHMRRAIREIGLRDISAVYSANDDMAGAVIDVLKQAGANPLPPVTGQDADLAAIRRIVAGDQYMTVYKPFQQEAEAAVDLAVARVRERSIEFDALTPDRVDSPSRKDIPAHLVPVVSVTRDTLKNTVIRDKVYKVSEICSQPYAAACAQLGLL